MQNALPAFLAATLALGGCEADYSLSPPADSEKVTVRVKLPELLEVETMDVMYRSPVCQRARYSASGVPYQVDGFHKIRMDLIREGESNFYSKAVPRNGGGECEWNLNSVTFGVRIANPTKYGENVTYGVGGGIVAIFDNNPSPRGSARNSVSRDLVLKENYYPWIDEEHIGHYKKTVNLLGKWDIYLMYKSPHANLIYFEPTYHPDFAVHSAGPKIKKKGNNTVFTYPDGTQDDALIQPVFRKLERIRLNKAAEE